MYNLKKLIYRLFWRNNFEFQPESPIETMYWNATKPVVPGLISQLNVGPYRLDFALPNDKIAIEVYGYEWHSSKEKVIKDAIRTRYLMRNGWQVIIFWGSEVYRNPIKCAKETENLIRELRKRNG